MRVLISFREWLHSYMLEHFKASLSEAGRSHLFQRVASFLLTFTRRFVGFRIDTVLISFREWLHSYWWTKCIWQVGWRASSHLFQRVASFLLVAVQRLGLSISKEFSSLSESGFIPTGSNMDRQDIIEMLFSSLSESGFIPTYWDF